MTVVTPTAAPTAAPTIDMGGLSNDDDDDEVRNILIGVAAGIVGAVILVSFLIILAWIVLRKRKKYDVKYDTSYSKCLGRCRWSGGLKVTVYIDVLEG